MQFICVLKYRSLRAGGILFSKLNAEQFCIRAPILFILPPNRCCFLLLRCKCATWVETEHSESEICSKVVPVWWNPQRRSNSRSTTACKSWGQKYFVCKLVKSMLCLFSLMKQMCCGWERNFKNKVCVLLSVLWPSSHLERAAVFMWYSQSVSNNASCRTRNPDQFSAFLLPIWPLTPSSNWSKSI